MKQLSKIFLFGLLLALASSYAHADTKVGAVNVSKLMDEAPQAKSASASIKAKFGTREKALLAERDELKKQEEKYNRDKDVMSVAEREKAESSLREKLRTFKRKSDDFTQDFSKARNKALEDLQSSVFSAITAVAESEGYDVVLSENVLYVNKRVDLTQKVLDKLKAGK
ncbi:MAG: OmpH family outer membrane protein [bacterium]